MKSTIIYLLPFLIIFSGCSLYKKLTSSNKMKVVRAGYQNWSHAPIHDSDVPEKGTDLAIIIQNWPEGASPEYIIYNNQKSLGAKISNDSSDIGTVISARIIKASSVLRTKSEKVDLSGRLVYTTNSGQTDFIAIKKWREISTKEDEKNKNRD